MKERESQMVTAGLSDKRLLDTNEVCYYLSLGRNRGSLQNPLAQKSR